LQRQHSELLAKFQAQEVEINRLKARVKNLKDQEGVIGDKSGDDAPIKGRSTNEGEAPAERISNDSEEIARKKLQEQIDAQMARELEEQQEKEDLRINEQIARDAEVARIHAEEEIQGMIDSLDKSNETVAKYLQEYQQFASDLSLEKKIELISDLVKYQDHYKKVYKIQSQQRKPMSKKQNSEYYMAVIKSYLGWRFKDFKEVSEDKIKEMMQLVPVEDVYVQALQVKHPIIDWKVHSEGERNYWQIIRLGGSTACYQFFVDLLRQLDREDLNQLWALVKEYLTIRPESNDKEMELWVELKRMYEPDPEDQLWTLTQNYMHAPVEWKLYDLIEVHHVTAKDKEIFMLVEKDYPLRRGLTLVMISYRLQV
nr:hypothetical protein [Tanacetum cinerariifolium]